MSRRVMTVIGGGCSGAIVAAHLLRTRDGTVQLVEPRDRLGRGVAYDTDDAWHLLNSRAGNMSALADVPDDFVRWCAWRRLRGGPDDFLPRRAYGRYLEATLDHAAAAHPGRLRVVRQRAVRVAPDAVELADGTRLRTDWTALALGHAPTTDPLGAPAGSPGRIGDPWAPGALDAVRAEEPVVLLGTGLTAVDVALSLARRGHYGGVHAVSRHGLLPRAHTARPGDPAAAPRSGAPGPLALPTGGESLGKLLRMVREAMETAADWRPVIDALRPRLDALWRGLTQEEQARFLRHVARYWEIHRHRMAPVVGTAVERLLDSGELTVTAGQVARATASGVALTDGRTLPGRTVINCTGPGCAARTGDPLVRGLVADGLARFDRHGLGLDVDDDGMLLGHDGLPSGRIWTVGPLRRGRWWETTAVPEIRAQTAAL
ncbi:FAD/NAD(P)-binding protein [Longispora sp. K20-0274]|uniref:FAD/NAD(P)-binding protein n=1 Tax=Longispora sp. K20-0274 TaxID=3088255 RepID=UPI00399A5BD2